MSSISSEELSVAWHIMLSGSTASTTNMLQISPSSSEMFLNLILSEEKVSLSC